MLTNHWEQVHQDKVQYATAARRSKKDMNKSCEYLTLAVDRMHWQAAARASKAQPQDLLHVAVVKHVDAQGHMKP